MFFNFFITLYIFDPGCERASEESRDYEENHEAEGFRAHLHAVSINPRSNAGKSAKTPVTGFFAVNSHFLFALISAAKLHILSLSQYKGSLC